MNLLEIQNKIHAQNVELGWWDEPRPFSTFVCLFHSELSEAMEGDRKGLMDDHLPQHPMFQVELADFVIRCMDWLGSKRNTIGYSKLLNIKSETTETELIANLHQSISESYSAYRDGFYGDAEDELVGAVNVCFGFSKMKGFNLEKIILEKVEYNRTRADHKRENRAKKGGKKY